MKRYKCFGMVGPRMVEDDNGDYVPYTPLFAAAPEMLEALKECKLYIGQMPHPDFVNGEVVDLIYKNVLDVIAKAEGRQQ